MASRNEVTCDILANIKGTPDAYADGLEFAKNSPKEWRHDYGNMRVLTTQEEVDEANSMPIPKAMRVIYKIGDDCPWHKVK